MTPWRPSAVAVEVTSSRGTALDPIYLPHRDDSNCDASDTLTRESGWTGAVRLGVAKPFKQIRHPL